MATPQELINLRTVLIPQVFPGGQAFSPEEEDFRRNLQDIINNIYELIVITGSNTGSIGAGFDAADNEVEAGAEVDTVVPFAGTITGVTTLSNVDGSIVIDVGKCTYADFPIFTSIVASAPPTLTTEQKSQDTTLTGWTVDFDAGDIFRFTVSSASVLNRAIVSLQVEKAAEAALEEA